MYLLEVVVGFRATEIDEGPYEHISRDPLYIT